jgi:hypothetical protein
LELESEGRKGVGRPGMRWLEDVENDLRVLIVKRWRLQANNRDEWAYGVTEAMFLESSRAKMLCVRGGEGETPLTASYPSPRAMIVALLIFISHSVTMHNQCSIQI